MVVVLVVVGWWGGGGGGVVVVVVVAAASLTFLATISVCNVGLGRTDAFVAFWIFCFPGGRARTFLAAAGALMLRASAVPAGVGLTAEGRSPSGTT